MIHVPVKFTSLKMIESALMWTPRPRSALNPVLYKNSNSKETYSVMDRVAIHKGLPKSGDGGSAQREQSEATFMITMML